MSVNGKRLLYTQDPTRGLTDYTLYEVVKILLASDKGVGAEDRFSEFKAFIKPYLNTTGFKLGGTTFFSQPLQNPLMLGIFNVDRHPDVDIKARSVVLDYFRERPLGHLLNDPLNIKGTFHVVEGFYTNNQKGRPEISSVTGFSGLYYPWGKKYFAKVIVENAVDEYRFFICPTKEIIKDVLVNGSLLAEGYDLGIDAPPFEVYTHYVFGSQGDLICHDLQGRVHTVKLNSKF